jgi:lipopolysaccharide export system protein LptA
MKWQLVKLVAAALLLLPITALALQSDRDQPISVEADRAELDQSTGIGTYSGSVVVVQGSMRLEADRLEIHSPSGGLESAVANGGPARFQQRPEGKDQDVRGGGRQIDYLATEDKVILTGDAWVTQAEDTVRGARIEYDLSSDRIRAVKGEGEQDRVRMILQPRQGKAN